MVLVAQASVFSIMTSFTDFHQEILYTLLDPNQGKRKSSNKKITLREPDQGSALILINLRHDLLGLAGSASQGPTKSAFG
jgi:hypothetical protein